MVMTILISLRRRALQKRYRKNQKYLYILRKFYFTKLCIMIEANNILDFKLDLIENLFTT